MSTREERIEGFRQLADLLEQNPGMPLPYEGGPGPGHRITIYLLGAPRERFVEVVRMLPGTVAKEVRGDTYDAVVQLAGITVSVVAYRNDVCERVVTGTREVTKTVPDPSITVPEIEVTEVIEDVEWRCHSLLSPEGGAA